MEAAAGGEGLSGVDGAVGESVKRGSVLEVSTVGFFTEGVPGMRRSESADLGLVGSWLADVESTENAPNR